MYAHFDMGFVSAYPYSNGCYVRSHKIEELSVPLMHKSSDKTLARSIQPQTMPKTFTLEQDRVYEGVRYVQQPLGYPTDGHREVATDFLTASAAYFECPRSWQP